MATIGFIGLGNMGGPMAINLLKAGHEVNAFDLSQAALDTVAAEGGHAATSAVEAATGADFIVSMLPAGVHVKGLYQTGDAPLFDVISKDALIIDSSTIDAATAQSVSAAANERGLSFIDAPVSGGVGGAVAGTLAFMVGATDAQFAKAKPILDCMGKNIFHAGQSGAGQIAKACNNMMLSILMAGTSEALNMGMKNGLDPAVLSEIMKQSSGNNWALQVYNPVPGVMAGVPSSNDYKGGFQVDLMFKDLGLAMELSQQSNSPVPMGSAARSLFSLHKSKGNGGLDFSSVIKLYQDS
ncbi:3-hydroxyisobutyrate dehydrogenase [Amphritea sp. 2_MG-2023]|jgi:3-hydroxyisobutyrate dehydrogenase|uniref:3-hydroxyisobutyrate dehydrogenase n=1 Tax=Amphritea TaxID=515417 RepID=UPI001C0793E5|nr:MULTISPECIES: 3-hydroxyisobutyrate dehydrogenase [Amphritea]MBU2964599.1 3-hydroxyisobutyrate dehydrogenase [Amphritea atlantica]MDO6417928.1 3-hydroxyisobutyrate dehydrogenase [Amphritea sp. 2_MG-2023]MDX2423124.1 3-hydroxyisobutyrate dehydrogenase [Amphritea sp.]